VASHNPDAFYPALNRMALQLVVNRGQPGWPGFKAETSAAVRRSLQNKAETDPDFWCFAGQMELDMYEAVAEGRLGKQAPALIAAYAELNGRVAARNYWASVADQALLVLEPYAAASRGAERDAAPGAPARPAGLRPVNEAPELASARYPQGASRRRPGRANSVAGSWIGGASQLAREVSGIHRPPLTSRIVPVV
jgi:hypothetical protein